MSTNWLSGINKPKTAEINGILKTRVAIGIFWSRINPFCIWHWGTVGEMKGYRTPFAKLGENKDENPNNGDILGMAAVVNVSVLGSPNI